ncbi:Hypothetical protein PHPALM_12706 [Phytophthora palmivora]|uniref:Uncharacterized protein n=1 Tax=Phytophthora palmivora TaxID=4796 RepID=A0A2P4XZ18_9STRA|nr:Hypothetical protein PHPALM_12706 [Phytophthora palmivora]
MVSARKKCRAEHVRAVWGELKAAGWTHKLPLATSLETRWKFIPHGGSSSGVEGKDYFLGEQSVLTHYASGMLISIAIQTIDYPVSGIYV